MLVHATFNITRMQQIISKRTCNYVLVSELQLHITGVYRQKDAEWTAGREPSQSAGVFTDLLWKTIQRDFSTI